MNSVIISGNICADIELRYTPSGAAVANFNVAINRKYKDRDGALKEEVSFIGVSTFGKQAETVAQYFKKGSPILVQGRLKQESWEKDGKKQSKTVVVMEQFEFMSRGEGKTAASAPTPKPAASAAPATAEPQDDSDVPF